MTRTLPQVTLAWASPIEVRRDGRRRVTNLVWSSARSRLDSTTEIMPEADPDGTIRFPSGEGPSGPFALGVLLEGRFTSYFDSRPLPEAGDRPQAADAADPPPDYATRLAHSPESARIVLFSSNDFMDDQVLNAMVAAAGTEYLGPLELFMNALDWALRDDNLLEIRSAGHFNRTLPPMTEEIQARLEYLNYGLALAWLALLALANRLWRALRRRHYAKRLAL